MAWCAMGTASLSRAVARVSGLFLWAVGSALRVSTHSCISCHPVRDMGLFVASALRNSHRKFFMNMCFILGRSTWELGSSGRMVKFTFNLVRLLPSFLT